MPTVNELRTLLIEHGVGKDVLAKSNKADLTKMLEDCESKKFDLEDALESRENEDAPESLEQAMPEMGSSAWNSAIMNMFEPTEVVDGHPTCAGLRRIATKILGPIVSSKVTNIVVKPEVDYAGVSYEIVFDWKFNFNIANIDLFDDATNNQVRVFGGSADCTRHNTMDKFANHALATAETRAEGRALRKALMLTKITAEEASASTEKHIDEIASHLTIPQNTKKMIEIRVKQNPNLVMADLIKEIGVEDRGLGELTFEEGKLMLDLINVKQNES